MPKASINGVDLYYRIFGEGEPVAFINGVLMTVPSWLIITDRLKNRFKCILHDSRGQILSGKPDTSYSMQQHADDFEKLLDQLHIDACHLVATSYGADYSLLAKMAGAKVIVHKFADPTYLITTIEEALQRSPFPKLPPK